MGIEGSSQMPRWPASFSTMAGLLMLAVAVGILVRFVVAKNEAIEQSTSAARQVIRSYFNGEYEDLHTALGEHCSLDSLTFVGAMCNEDRMLFRRAEPIPPDPCGLPEAKCMGEFAAAFSRLKITTTQDRSDRESGRFTLHLDATEAIALISATHDPADTLNDPTNQFRHRVDNLNGGILQFANGKWVLRAPKVCAYAAKHVDGFRLDDLRTNVKPTIHCALQGPDRTTAVVEYRFTNTAHSAIDRAMFGVHWKNGSGEDVLARRCVLGFGPSIKPGELRTSSMRIEGATSTAVSCDVSVTLFPRKLAEQSATERAADTEPDCTH